MSEISVGSVSVDVVPDARRFPRQLASQVNPEAAKIGQEFGRLFGAAAQKEMAGGVRDGLSTGSREATEQGARQGEQFGGSFARTLKARLESALRSLPDIEINADSNGAQREIASLRAQLEDLRDKRVGVDIDAAEASRRLDELSNHLRLLSEQSPDVNVRVDSAAAAAELSKFQAEVNRLDGQNPTVRPDVDTAAASSQLALLSAQASGTGSSFSGLLTSALLLGPALVPIAAVGAGAMAAIGVGALAAASGVGVLLLALVPVIGAIQAVQQANDKSGSSARGATSAHLQMASAMDAVANAQRGLATAVEDSRVSQIRSAEAVAQARRAVVDAEAQANRDQLEDLRRFDEANGRLTDAQEQAARDQVAADRRVEDAHRRLNDARREAAAQADASARRVVQAERTVIAAQKQALAAQQALTDARKRAGEDAEDLANRVVDGQLAERSAVLSVQRAQEDLAETIADPKATDQQRAQAQLAYDEAVQQLAEQQLQNRRLAEQKEASDKAGIEGSQAVQDASQRLIDAQQRAVDAQQELADAVAAQAEQQRKSAQEIADAHQGLVDAVAASARQQEESANKVAQAEQGVADAVAASVERQRRDLASVADAHRRAAGAARDAADQQRRSADAIVSAQAAVVSAQRGVQQASQSAGAAGGAAMESVRSKLAALSPEGRAFVGFITGSLLPAFGGLAQAAQTGLLPGLQDGIAALLPFIPQLTQFVGDLAGVMGDLFRDAGKALTGPFWKQFFGFVSSVAGPALDIMGRTVGNLAEGFAGLLEAFAPVALQMGKGLLDLAGGFADFGKNAGSNDGLQSFIAYVIENGPRVAEAFGAIVGAVGNVLSALAPLGPVVLGVVTAIGNFIAGLDRPTLLAIAGGITAIAVAFGVANAVAAILAVNPVVLWIIGITVLIAALVVGVVYAWNNFETFRTVVIAVWEAVQAATAAAWAFLQPILAAIWGFITGTLAPAFVSFWRDVIVPVWDGIKAAIGFAWNAIIKPVFAAIVGFVTGVLIPVFNQELRPVIELVWNVIKVAIQLAWSIIQVIFKAIVLYVREVLAPVFTWLYENVIKPVWDGISTAIAAVWENAIKPVFEALGGFVRDKVAPAFRTGVEAIGKAWEKVRDIAKMPVKFIIDTIINDGIIGTWNRIAGWFGVDPVERIKLPDGFASGGLLSGPGSGTSDDILARVSNGEYIVRAAAVDTLGVNFLDMINQADRLDIAGDPSSLVVRRRFAEGGVVEAARSWLPSVDPLPYVWGGVGPDGYDCSGITGEVWARLTNNPNFRRYMVTQSNFGDLGFKQGTGVYTIGVTNNAQTEHMAGNLAGLPFEARSTATGIFVGPSARSVMEFDKQYYLDGMGGSPDGEPGGIDLTDPIGSLRALFDAVLAPLADIGGGAFGQLISGLPRKAVDWAMHWVQDLFSFADGGLVGRDGASDRPMLYDSGGYLPPGLTTVLNATGRPEPVLTPGQWNSVQSGDGGQFTGQLVLDSGEFLGVVRGEIRRSESDLVGALSVGSGNRRP